MKTILKAIFGISVPAAALIYTVLFFRKSLLAPFVIFLDATIIVAYLASMLTTAGWKSKVQNTVYIFNITYLFAELASTYLLSFGLLRPDMRFFYNGLEATNKPLAVYDTVCGYRAVPGIKRYLSISNSTAEIDHLTTANPQGWYSKQAYTYSKKSKRIKRYMVLGDSFSSGIVLPTTWPDQVQQLLQANGNDSVELYNFSVDGSGIQNWYGIFFKEIVPHYEFDGIVIAVSAELDGVPDFDRKLIIGQSKENTTYMGVVDITTQHPDKAFPFDKATPIASVYNDEKLNENKARYASTGAMPFRFRPVKADLHFLSIFLGVTDGIYKALCFSKKFAAYNRPYETYYALASKPYQMQYFDDRYKYGYMLKEIMAYCQTHDKKIVFAGIPDTESSKNFVAGQPCIYRNEVKFLADHYKAAYFDGYSILQNKNTAFVDSIFYRYDRHWNTKGAGLFAQRFAESNLLR